MIGGAPRRERSGKQRSPSGFLYDRLVPALLVVLGLVLAAVVILSVAAMLGLIPMR